MKRAAKVDSKTEWIELVAELDQIGVRGLMGVYIDQDAKRSDQYAIHLTQSGISLPDRDYYLLDDARYVEARKALESYLRDVFQWIGEPESEQKARDVLAFETAIAKIQWSNVELRDPIKTYNKVAIARFADQHPNLDWRRFSANSGLPIDGDLIIGQPSFFEGLDKLIAASDLATLRAYLCFKIVDTFAGVLDEARERRHFEFHETALSGVTDQEPLWKRGVEACNSLLGMPVGQLYVERHFPGSQTADAKDGRSSQSGVCCSYRTIGLDE